jgi:menaquinone-9 beta-reductase
MRADPVADSVAEVLVVGAGPAGIAAAITAQQRGLRTIVVDKATFPRDKTCGDGLTANAVRLLARLGFDLDALPSYTPIAETVIVSPDGTRVSLPMPVDGRLAGVVPRLDLDAALVAHARTRDVVVREGAGVRELAMTAGAVRARLADGTGVRARWVIAADGQYSTVRRLLDRGTPRDLGTSHAFRQYFSGVDEPRLHVLFERDLLPGYAWVFPLTGGRANVGFGVVRGPGVTGKSLARVSRELSSRPSIRSVIGSRATPEGSPRSWPIPATFDATRLTNGRVLFAGDAAGVVDPLTGEGIAQALETAMLAAGAVAAGGPPGAVRGRYRYRVDRALGADLRLARHVQRVLRSERRTRVAMRAVDTNDWTRRNFARWMFEDYPRALALTPRRWSSLPK